jgi:hypothetical protein
VATLIRRFAISAKNCREISAHFREWRSLAETASGHRNPDKIGTNQLNCFASATTVCYHPSTGVASMLGGPL